MAKMFTSGFKPKSTTNDAKRIIRSEIRSYGWDVNRLNDQIDSFKKYDRYVRNSYQGGKKLVEGGSFACYYSQTNDMLGKIYGKKNVSAWSNDKKRNTYTHLMAREIDSVCRSGKMNISNSSKRKR